MPPKRRFWKGFRACIAADRPSHLGVGARVVGGFIFCSSFQNLRLGSIHLSEMLVPTWLPKEDFVNRDKRFGLSVQIRIVKLVTPVWPTFAHPLSMCTRKGRIATRSTLPTRGRPCNPLDVSTRRLCLDLDRRARRCLGLHFALAPLCSMFLFGGNRGPCNQVSTPESAPNEALTFPIRPGKTS